MRMPKQQRQHLIAKLIGEYQVASQAELVELLAKVGVEATQATVSRDLEELGALKVRGPGGGSVYALAEAPARSVPSESHLRRVLGEWVLDVSHSANLVVMRTLPGSAHVVASALDRSSLEGIIGTVAGDDTLLVVATEGVGGSELALRLARLAGVGEGSFDRASEGEGEGPSGKSEAMAGELERE